MMFSWRPNRQGFIRTLILWFVVASFSANLLFASRSNAQDQQPDDQDVAATARQQKARKSTKAKPKSHVYTNNDLQKSQILTTPDRARVEARKKSASPPQTLEPAPSLDANGDSPAESLGKVARHYRREKATDAAEQASRPKPPSPFPMDLSQPTFATPAPVGPPLSAPLAPASKPRPTQTRSVFSSCPFSFLEHSDSWTGASHRRQTLAGRSARRTLCAQACIDRRASRCCGSRQTLNRFTTSGHSRNGPIKAPDGFSSNPSTAARPGDFFCKGRFEPRFKNHRSTGRLALDALQALARHRLPVAGLAFRQSRTTRSAVHSAGHDPGRPVPRALRSHCSRKSFGSTG